MSLEQSWSRYYAEDSGFAIDGFPAGVRSMIESRWNRAFRALPAQSTIVDIGTGGGGLLRLAAQTASAQRPLQLIGVDSATVASRLIPDFPFVSCVVHDDTDFASLPLDDRSAQLIVSQFAIEYGGMETALKEASRVCDGHFLALIHAKDGVVVAQNAPLVDQVRWLLEELQLTEKLRRFMKNQSGENADALKEIANAMAGRMRDVDDPAFLQSLTRDVGQFLLRHQEFSISENLDRVGAFEQALRDQSDRMSALVAAARNDNDMDNAVDQLEQEGFAHASWTTCEDADRVIGYWLEARRG